MSATPAPVATFPPPVPVPLSGVASWYCLTGRSACTAGHPSGLFAAAGAPLREQRPDWRGSTVRVTYGGRSVRVTLIDWCACPDRRAIDLYADAFAFLAPLSRGLLDVNFGLDN